jgi:hypothetical protein
MRNLFTTDRNVGRYERLLVICTDADQREALEGRLAVERRKPRMRSLPAPSASPQS